MSEERKYYNRPFKKYTNGPLRSIKDFLPKEEKKSIKYKYFSPDGAKLAAGGIFFYEEINGVKGIWLLKEKEEFSNYEDESDEKIIYTDFGGKYDYNDGDIYATISREFREETYNNYEITYKKIKSLPDDCKISVEGYDGKIPVYVCFACHISFVIENNGESFSSDKIKRSRIEVERTNPTIPKNWYRTIDISFLPLDNIRRGDYKLSNRITAVLKNLLTQENINKSIKEFFT